VLIKAQGLPVGVAVTLANVHEIKHMQAVIDSMFVLPPPPEGDFAPGFCADKGHKAEAVRCLLTRWVYRVHILGQRKRLTSAAPGCRACRWVFERTHAWFNRFRRLLIRWEKKVTNYEALLHLACANTVWRHSLLFFG